MRAKELYPALFSRYAVPYTERHDEIDRQGKNRGRARVLELVGVRPGESVLDLACGPGKLTGSLLAAAGPGALVAGVDLARGMLEVATSRVPEARYLLMDIEQLGFADGSFDAAVCGHGVQFCPDLAAALAEARRVLRPGGRLGASVSADPPDQRAFEALNRYLDSRLPPAAYAEDNLATREVVADLPAFREAALRAGFREAHTEAVRDTTVWRSPAHMVEVSLGWWSIAQRLEGLTAEARASVLAEASGRLEAAVGPGPIRVPGVDHVLFARN